MTKEEQLEIILSSNPAEDDLHVWIRSVDDILTFEEAFAEGSCEPDFTDEDIDSALRTGRLIVYSSKPIKNGIFVTPSAMEASAYSGNRKIYRARVNVDDVAWIDDSQGQLATNNHVTYIQVDAKRM